LTGGGQVTATYLYATNANFGVSLRSGTLNLKNGLFSRGVTQVVGDGMNGATLNLLPGGTNVFADGLTVADNATLAGAGLIRGVTTVAGTLSPGMAGTGVITNDGDCTLRIGSLAKFDLAANTTPGAGWDALYVTNGALRLGGSLKVTALGGSALTNTDRFVIMTNAGPLNVAGVFDNAGNGEYVAVYTNDSETIGRIRVEIGNQDVALSGFQMGLAPKRRSALLQIW
jgi:hypothetical protein